MPTMPQGALDLSTESIQLVPLQLVLLPREDLSHATRNRARTRGEAAHALLVVVRAAALVIVLNVTVSARVPPKLS